MRAESIASEALSVEPEVAWAAAFKTSIFFKLLLLSASLSQGVLVLEAGAAAAGAPAPAGAAALGWAAAGCAGVPLFLRHALYL